MLQLSAVGFCKSCQGLMYVSYLKSLERLCSVTLLFNHEIFLISINEHCMCIFNMNFKFCVFLSVKEFHLHLKQHGWYINGLKIRHPYKSIRINFEVVFSSLILWHIDDIFNFFYNSFVESIVVFLKKTLALILWTLLRYIKEKKIE